MDKRKELNEELKGSDVKKEHKVEDIKFIPDEGINGRYVTFIGRKYTRNQFITMLQLMQKGLFLYPDELIKNEDNPDAETEKVKGWVITRSLVPISDLNDSRLVALTDNFDDIDDDFLVSVKFQRNNGFNFKALISDDFVDMISTFLNHGMTTTHLRVLPDVVVNRWCKFLYDIDDDGMYNIKHLGVTAATIVDLDHKTRYELITEKINKVFNVIRHNHYCMVCDTFAPTLRVRFKRKEDDDYQYAYACTTCRLKSADKHTAKSTKINRNEPCTCGSGLKYKRCCGK